MRLSWTLPRLRLTKFLNFSIVDFMNAIIKVNSRGTLTLPKAMRKALGVADGGTLLCDLQGGNVVLQSMMAYPIEMYTDERIAEFKEDEDSIGDIEGLLEREGLVYDPETWSIRKKEEMSMVGETQTPYQTEKTPKKKKA